MTNWIKLLTSTNVFVYQITKGRLGNRLGKQSILLLHTIGRRSGKRYTTTLSYYRDGNSYLVVASNWGKENHPGWFHNLMQQPHTTIQVRANTIQVEARQAQGEEYQRLWQLVTQLNEQYVQYEKRMDRRIPIVVLSPVE